MRCSWCEPLLDEYVEATLEPRRSSAVAAHLRSCAACEGLHRHLRVVDALLATARTAELQRDFTYDVMAHVRTLPAPAAPARPLLPLAIFYLVAAWIFAGAMLSLVWTGAPAAAMQTVRRTGGDALQALSQSTHAIWPVAPLALSVVVSVLSIDVLLVAALVVFYRSVRPRLTAYLTATAEVL